MGEIARFRCPHCLQLTSFRPAVHEALFGQERIAPSFVSYYLTCKHCRKPFLFAIRKPPELAPRPDGAGLPATNGDND
jgi:hypothetical protein